VAVAVQTNGTLLADRYRVIRRLGSGGAATVFLCEDQRLGREVAVKRMHADSPEDMARRLHREARLGASLNHPNLVSVFDTVTYDEGVLIIMEYVDGETLADALGRGPLETERALEVIRGVASALDHAHSHGVVHRDVKPGNVLLGHGGSVKLADLGIGTAADHTRITKSGTVLGTPSYMAPEQVEGAKAGPAADVYSLATVAYEMLTGKKARTGRTPLEVAHRAATEPPPDLRDDWPGAPATAAEALKRAMARDPRHRPQSAGELADELSHALGRSVHATRIAATAPLPHVTRREPLASPLLRGGRKFPRWVPVLALLIACGVAALAIATSGGGGSESGSQDGASGSTRPQSTSQPTRSPQPTAADRGRALNAQGKALIDAGQPAQAIPILEQAVKAFPADARGTDINYAYALFNLADAYLKAGQPEKAIPLLEQRLKIPNQTDVVQAELDRALAAAGQSPAPGGKRKGKKKHGGD
jgi:serine/threonine protein kinase